MIKMRTGLLLLSLAALLLAGCGPKATPAPTPEPTPVGIANPASVYCEDNGGQLEIRDEAGGQVGYCLFPDGSECEEWAYFRNECTPGATPGAIGMANPASVYCIDNGGQSEIRDEAGGQVGYCIFSDGSECEEWAYYRGECAPASQPAGADLVPLGRAECADLADVAAATLGVEMTVNEVQVQDPISGKSGTACGIAASGTGDDFESFFAVAESLRTMLTSQGWTEDMMYAADGPTGTGFGMHQDAKTCMVMSQWMPSEDAACPDDQPISECELTPIQQIYTITLNCYEDASGE